jgi:hypothetical protein
LGQAAIDDGRGAPRECEVRRVRPLVNRESARLQNARELSLQRYERRLRRACAQPCDTRAPKAANFIEREHEAFRPQVSRKTAQRVDANRWLRPDKS